MNARTQACMNDLVKFAREGHEIYPMFFSHSYGAATTSAAVRAAHRAGLIEQAGVDGVGKPKWRAVIAQPTHAAPACIN
jgi:hypothetical protein